MKGISVQGSEEASKAGRRAGRPSAQRQMGHPRWNMADVAVQTAGLGHVQGYTESEH